MHEVDSQSTDRRAVRAEYCVVGIPHNTAIQVEIYLFGVLVHVSPFPQIDIIGAVVIVWRVRGKTIRSVLCNIVCNNCA